MCAGHVLLASRGQVGQLEGSVRAKQDELDATRREISIIESSYRRQLSSLEARPPVTIERTDPRVVADLAREQGRAAHLATQLSAAEASVQSLTTQLAALDRGWSEKHAALQRRLDDAEGTARSAGTLCADLEALARLLDPHHDEAALPSAAGMLGRAAGWLAVIDRRARALVRDCARLRDERKTLAVDKEYLATELQSKVEQVRRLSALHQEEKTLLLDRIEQEQRVVRRLQGVSERHFHETTSVLARSEAAHKDRHAAEPALSRPLLSEEGERLLSESMLAGGKIRSRDASSDASSRRRRGRDD